MGMSPPNYRTLELFILSKMLIAWASTYHWGDGVRLVSRRFWLHLKSECASNGLQHTVRM